MLLLQLMALRQQLVERQLPRRVNIQMLHLLFRQVIVAVVVLRHCIIKHLIRHRILLLHRQKLLRQEVQMDCIIFMQKTTQEIKRQHIMFIMIM